MARFGKKAKAPGYRAADEQERRLRTGPPLCAGMRLCGKERLTHQANGRCRERNRKAASPLVASAQAIQVVGSGMFC